MSEVQGRRLAEERRRAPQGLRPFGRRAVDRIELTDRQQEVLRLVAEGLENKEIAARLEISEQGVKQQVSVLLKKFGAPSRAVLASTALAMRLLGPHGRELDIPVQYLFDRAPVLIAMTRGTEHEFTLANRAFVETFGERGYVGKTLREAFPDIGPELMELIDRIVASGQPWIEHERRLRFAMPDGTQKEVHLSLVGEPMRTAGGEIEGVVFYAWDVSAQIALREQLQRLTIEQRTLIEQLPVGVIYTDAHARPVLVNPVARRILGRSLDPDQPLYETLVGWNVRYAATGAPVEPSKAPSARAIAGWPFDDDVLVGTSEGTKTIHVSARPLHEPGGGISGAVLVLTERTSAGIPADRAPMVLPEEAPPRLTTRSSPSKRDRPGGGPRTRSS